MADDPVKVEIAAPTPVPVKVINEAALSSGSMQPGQVGGAAPNKPDVMTLADGRLVAAPTTTEEEDRVSLGQRDTSMVWETTQAKIAIAVVYAALATACILSLIAVVPWATERQMAVAITAFMLLSSLSSLVIGFYYGRTNHQKIGGVGPVTGR